MEIQIQNKKNKTKIIDQELKKKITCILNALGFENAELSVLITDDREIEKLNSKYRSKNESTNVLSFPVEEGENIIPGLKILGDVVISEETALRESRAASITLDERISQLIIHGILHLVGYDHELGPEEDEKMTQKSIELISLIENNKDLSYWM